MDKVFIEGLQIDALIGIYDWERRIRQTLRFDIEMGFDNRRPAATDRIEDTLDYKAVSRRLEAYVKESGFGLVETLAERCVEIILAEYLTFVLLCRSGCDGNTIAGQPYGAVAEQVKALRTKEGVCHQCKELDVFLADGDADPLPGDTGIDARLRVAAAFRDRPWGAWHRIMFRLLDDLT